MKKSLIAIAVLGATALTANAASVSLYGNLDAGVAYQHHKKDGEKTSSFKMVNGIASDNYIGLKGSEELGADMKAGFVLENGFTLSDGKLEKEKTLFSREARLFVDGVFGELSAGRMGSLGNGNGSYNIVFKNMDAMNGRNQTMTGFVKTPVLNNAVAYKTPTFGGFTGYAQYSFGVVDQNQDKHKDNNRFFALGGTYSIANVNLAGSVEQGLPGKDKADDKKPLVVNFGGNVAFDDLTVFSGVQYARHLHGNNMYFSVSKLFSEADQERLPLDKSLAGTIGAKYVFGNSEVSGAGYLARHKFNDFKTDVMGLAARYDYHLSSRTAVYLGTDMARVKVKDTDSKGHEISVYSGVKHSF